MNKAELTAALAAYGYEAKEGTTNAELELFLEAFDSRNEITSLKETLDAQIKIGLQVTELTAQNEVLQSTIADMQKVIDSQANAVEEAEASSPVVTITHEKKKYTLAVPQFKLSGVAGDINAERLRENSELVARVLEIKGQNILKAQ